MPPEQQKPIERFILYQYRTKREWQYLGEKPGQAGRLENSIGNHTVDSNSYWTHFSSIVCGLTGAYLLVKYILVPIIGAIWFCILISQNGLL